MPEECLDILNLHAFLPASRANGPGRRAVIWFQGCSLDCPDCFNPGARSTDPQTTVRIPDLVERILDLARSPAPIQGITLSGGEPLRQPEGLHSLLQGVRNSGARLSVLLFSGFTLKEIQRLPSGRQILALVDVLIDGRYDSKRRLARELRGSSNQRIHLLTDRYRREDVEATPPVELIVHAGGDISMTGIAPL